MSRDEQLDQAQRDASVGQRLRDQFGLVPDNPNTQAVTDWLESRGAVPVTIAVVVLVVGLVVAFVSQVFF